MKPPPHFIPGETGSKQLESSPWVFKSPHYFTNFSWQSVFEAKNGKSWGQRKLGTLEILT